MDEVEQIGAYTVLGPAALPVRGSWWRAADAQGDPVWLRRVDEEQEPADAVSRAFERIAHLSTPGIPAVVEHSADDGVLVLRAAPSVSLASILARRRDPGFEMTPGSVLDLGLQLAEILVAAHERGRPHGHLSPDVIWVDAEGKLQVWGFEEGTETPSAAAWWAPEVARGKRPSGDADQWALGAVLGALVTGRVPWSQADPRAEARAGDASHLSGPVIAQWKPLGRLIARMLSSTPRDRFPSVHPVRQALLALRQRVSQPSGLSVMAQTLLLDPEGAADPAADTEAEEGTQPTLFEGASEVTEPSVAAPVTSAEVAPGQVEALSEPAPAVDAVQAAIDAAAARTDISDATAVAAAAAEEEDEEEVVVSAVTDPIDEDDAVAAEGAVAEASIAGAADDVAEGGVEAAEAAGEGAEGAEGGAESAEGMAEEATQPEEEAGSGELLARALSTAERVAAAVQRVAPPVAPLEPVADTEVQEALDPVALQPAALEAVDELGEPDITDAGVEDATVLMSSEDLDRLRGYTPVLDAPSGAAVARAAPDPADDSVHGEDPAAEPVVDAAEVVDVHVEAEAVAPVAPSPLAAEPALAGPAAAAEDEPPPLRTRPTMPEIDDPDRLPTETLRAVAYGMLVGLMALLGLWALWMNS